MSVVGLGGDGSLSGACWDELGRFVFGGRNIEGFVRGWCGIDMCLAAFVLV